MRLTNLFKNICLLSDPKFIDRFFYFRFLCPYRFSKGRNTRNICCYELLSAVICAFDCKTIRMMFLRITLTGNSKEVDIESNSTCIIYSLRFIIVGSKIIRMVIINCIFYVMVVKIWPFSKYKLSIRHIKDTYDTNSSLNIFCSSLM